MKNWSREYDDMQDCSYWNRRLKMKILRYEKATEEKNSEQKRAGIIEILELFDEDCNYKLDAIKLNDEQYSLASEVKEIVTDKWKPTYGRTQKDWNEELSEAVEQGDLIRTLKLVKIGKRMAYIIKPSDENAKYIQSVKKLMYGISKNLEREER